MFHFACGLLIINEGLQYAQIIFIYFCLLEAAIITASNTMSSRLFSCIRFWFKMPLSARCRIPSFIRSITTLSTAL